MIYFAQVAAILCLIAYGIAVGQDPTTPKDNLWLGIALLVVVVITAVFAYYQESKAGKIMESFKKMVCAHLNVRQRSILFSCRYPNRRSSSVTVAK
jgi:magnesium-transporting ATPase (P-type)